VPLAGATKTQFHCLCRKSFAIILDPHLVDFTLHFYTERGVVVKVIVDHTTRLRRVSASSPYHGMTSLRERTILACQTLLRNSIPGSLHLQFLGLISHHHVPDVVDRFSLTPKGPFPILASPKKASSCECQLAGLLREQNNRNRSMAQRLGMLEFEASRLKNVSKDNASREK
jgi:hypothetical protein